MKATKIELVFFLALSLVICFPLMVYAQSCQKGAQAGCGLDKRIFWKIHCIMTHQDLLNLSEDQVARINQLKISTKKDLIERDAEIDLVRVDMKSKLCEARIDTKGLGKLIDRKYDLKKAKAKALVGAHAELNNVLSVEQHKQLKTICRRKKQCPKTFCPKTQSPKSQCPKKTSRL